MTLEEAIKHAEEVADVCEFEASKYDMTDAYESYVACQEGECAAEHRQLAEWLKELKTLRKQDVPDTNVGDTISRQAAIDAALSFIVEYCGAAFDENMQIGLKQCLDGLPSAEPEPHYCRECKWSQCYLTECVNTGMLWYCLNWGDETDEEGYCHEFKRRTDERDKR